MGNSTDAGFDVVKEIRWLGKDRICQIHLKDNPNYHGGRQDSVRPDYGRDPRHRLQGLRRAGNRLKSAATLDADTRKNLAYIRALKMLSSSLGASYSALTTY